MKRVVLLAVSLLVPALAAAQVPPPPRRPPAAPAPHLRLPVPPSARHRSADGARSRGLEDYVRSAMDAARAVDVEAVRDAAIRPPRCVDTQAAREREGARGGRPRARKAQLAHEDAFRSGDAGVALRLPGSCDAMMTQGAGRGEQLLHAGLSLIQQRQYDQAITRFDRAIAQKGTHADGALYWKAFAQSKLGKGDEAVASIAELRKDFPQSRYLNDAKVLEADVRKLGSRRRRLNDDEIKLLAIQGIQNVRPGQAAPLLEGAADRDELAPGEAAGALRAGAERPAARARGAPELREGRRQSRPAARSHQLHRVAPDKQRRRAPSCSRSTSRRRTPTSTARHRRLPPTGDKAALITHRVDERRADRDPPAGGSAASPTSRRRRICGRSTRRKRTRTCACRWSACSDRWARSISCSRSSRPRRIRRCASRPSAASATEDDKTGHDADRHVRQRDRQGQQAWR